MRGTYATLNILIARQTISPARICFLGSRFLLVPLGFSPLLSLARRRALFCRRLYFRGTACQSAIIRRTRRSLERHGMRTDEPLVPPKTLRGHERTPLKSEKNDDRHAKQDGHHNRNRHHHHHHPSSDYRARGDRAPTHEVSPSSRNPSDVVKILKLINYRRAKGHTVTRRRRVVR